MLVFFYGLNIFLLMLVGHGYLTNIPAGTSALGWAQTVLAYAANFAMWALVPLLCTLPTFFFRRAWITWVVAIVLFGAMNVFIYADSIIYQLWRFHFNGFVVNLLTTPGAGDSVTAGKATVATTSLIVGLIVAAEIGLLGVVWPRLRKLAFMPRLRSMKAFSVSAAAVAGLIVLDKTLYDVGDLRQDTEVLRLRQLLPLYQTVTVKRFANRVLGMNISPNPKLKLHTGGSLDYPKKPLAIPADAPRPNVVIIAIEGARFDMLTPEVMPHLSAWGENNLVFDEAYSSGNTTRYGIFGLLYGIHGTYWQRALAERRGPAMIQALKQRGYNFRILGCTDLNYPEFRSTAFVDVPDAITDKWDCPRWQRDELMTDALIKFVEEQRMPFFAFLFYDASHQPYRYPPEHAVFDTGTTTDEINYIDLARKGGDVHFVQNRYRNSLHYVDAQIDRVLRCLENRGLLDNTLVFITGDHGEAFGELGLFGHDSAFDRYQAQTLFVAHIPGQAPRHVRRLTSHEDVPATVLTLMGVSNPLSDFSQGLSLLSDSPRLSVFVASWGVSAIVDTNSITSFGLEAYNAETTVLDTNDVPLANQRDALRAHQGELLAVLEAMRQFNK